jgi:hypothetical protein
MMVMMMIMSDLSSLCLSVYPRETIQLPLVGYSYNDIGDCLENTHLVKIGQKYLALCLET